MIDNVIVFFPYEIQGFNTIPVFEKLKDVKNTTVILWQGLEFHSCQMMEYLEWNYNLTGGEHCENVRDFENLLIRNNINVYVITGGDERSTILNNIQNNPIRNLNFICWPTFLLHYAYYGATKNLGNIDNLGEITNFDKFYLCLNAKGRNHRALFIDNLSKHNLFNDGIVTWNSVNRDNYEFKYWNEEIIKYDNYDFSNQSTEYSNVLFSKALVNVVTETSEHPSYLFITEKTYKPILFEQPFICLGAKNQNHGLERFGFQLYDELFDYSFDTECELQKRIDGIIDNLLKIKNDNLIELYKKVKNKVKLNKQRALDIINNDPYVPNILIELYKLHGNDFISLFGKLNVSFNSSYHMESSFVLLEEILKNKI